MTNTNSLELTLLSKQLENYTLQRHDFMNHWQVIMGYLQLGKADKALDYMKKALDNLRPEQIVGQIPQPVVSAILLDFVISLRSEEIMLEIEVSQVLKEKSFWEEYWQEEYGQPLYGYTKEWSLFIQEQKVDKEDAKTYVMLEHSEGGFKIYTRLFNGDNVIKEDSFVFDKTKGD